MNEYAIMHHDTGFIQWSGTFNEFLTLPIEVRKHMARLPDSLVSQGPATIVIGGMATSRGHQLILAR